MAGPERAAAGGAPRRAAVERAAAEIARAERARNVRVVSLIQATIGGTLASMAILLAGLEGYGPAMPGALAGLAVLALALASLRDPLESGYLQGLVFAVVVVLGMSFLFVDYPGPLLWTHFFSLAPLLVLTVFNLGETSGVSVGS